MGLIHEWGARALPGKCFIHLAAARVRRIRRTRAIDQETMMTSDHCAVLYGMSETTVCLLLAPPINQDLILLIKASLKCSLPTEDEFVLAH